MSLVRNHRGVLCEELYEESFSFIRHWHRHLPDSTWIKRINPQELHAHFGQATGAFYRHESPDLSAIPESSKQAARLFHYILNHPDVRKTWDETYSYEGYLKLLKRRPARTDLRKVDVATFGWFSRTTGIGLKKIWREVDVTQKAAQEMSESYLKTRDEPVTRAALFLEKLNVLPILSDEEALQVARHIGEKGVLEDKLWVEDRREGVRVPHSDAPFRVKIGEWFPF